MDLIQQLTFNIWYFSRPPWDTGISPPELLDFIAHNPVGRAIDLGCGSGTNVITLTQAGWEVTGIDFAPRAIHLAKQKTRLKNLSPRLVVADSTNLRGIAGEYDLALDIGCFHGINNKEAYLTNLDRILVQGGHWLMYGFIDSTVHPSIPGLTSSNLDMIQSHGLIQIWRKDGFNRGSRPSAWFLFKKP